MLREPGAAATVLLGELAGARSPGQVHTALIGVDVTLERGADACCRWRATSSTPCSRSPAPRRSTAASWSPGRCATSARAASTLRLRAETPSRLLLLGGIPFTEKIVMWWNFIARTGEEITAARDRWQAELAEEPAAMSAASAGSFRPGPFGAVPGFEGPALAAPPLPSTPLRPRRPHPLRPAERLR